MDKCYYITSDGAKNKLIMALDIINISGYKEVIELIIQDGITDIHCSNNRLTKLDIPDSVKYIWCKNNLLTELIVPDDCFVDCDPDCKVITRTMYNRSNRLKNLLK